MSFGSSPSRGGVFDFKAKSGVEYHEPTQSYRVEFDRYTRMATEAVVTAVAAATDSAPTELPPLWSAIDPDALDRLFTVNRNRDVCSTIVSFEYAGHDVTVNGHGTVIVEPTEDTQS